jgi:hypothetical protein
MRSTAPRPHVRAFVSLAVVFVSLTLVVTNAWAVPPELPRVFLDTTYVPPTGATIAVAAGGNLQNALNAAQPGDVITLAAGATFRGPFTLPNKAGTGWITIRTSAADSSLPAPGTRVTPAYAAVMPKITVGAGVGGAIQTANGAHHYRFIGIEVKPVAGAMIYSLIELGMGSETSEAALPHDIVIDRCYIHGNAGEPAVRGVALNGKAQAVIDSYIADFKDDFLDTQAIIGWNGSGPFKIVNNYLEATGENVMFGGADPSITNLVPSDIEIRHNHFFKPTSWNGVWNAVKNLFELKNARRVLVDGNIMENVWLAAQSGFAVQLTVRNQDGTAPWSTIEDVTFRKNVVRDAAQGVNVLGTDDLFPSRTMARVLIEGNLFDNVTCGACGGGKLFQILDYQVGTSDVAIQHNTGFQDGPLLYAEGRAHTRFVYRDNLTPRGTYGVLGAGSSEGSNTLSTYFPGVDFRRNAIVGGNAAIYPTNNFFPATLNAVGFVDRLAGNYRLLASSAYKNAATDGTDVGADIDALEAATAGVLTGTSSADTTAPTVALTAPLAGATVTGSAVTVAATAADASGIARVQFKLDGANLGGPVTSAPYTIAWNSTTASGGPHTLTAQAVDGAGNTVTSAPVTVTVSNDTTAPTVSITSPTAGQTVSGTVSITASASDNVGVTRLDYLVDGAMVATFTPAVLTFAWDTTPLTNGAHSLTARARDAAGNTTTSAAVAVTVSNGSPAPVLTSLNPSSATAGGVAFTLTVNGNSFVSGSSVRWNGAARTTTFVSATQLAASIAAADIATAGSASVTVVTPAPGGGTSSAAAFVVNPVVTPPADTTPPTVAITGPLSGSTIGGLVTVTASAVDNVGVAGVQFKVDGANLGAETTTAPYRVPWDTVTAVNGSHALTAVARDAAGNTATAPVATVVVSNVAPPPARSPYRGVPSVVPGVIEAEDFDNGGEGIAWHDTTPGNQGGAYRTGIDVDLIAATGTAKGAVVNDFQTGEWLAYTVNVVQSGIYRLEIHASSEQSTGRWHAEVDGVNLTGSVAVPNTGRWSTFQWIGVGGIPLTAGTHVLRIHADQQYFNLDAIRLRSPYKGTPFVVPGQIEAEDFDNGGEGVSWHDTTPGNQGGAYRTTTDVDLIAATGNAVGAVVNNFQKGEWLEYTISVAQAGLYRLEVRASSEQSTGRWHVEVDGINVTGTVAVPNTGSWSTFRWVGVDRITLSAGTHVLRLRADQQYFNLDAIAVRASGNVGASVPGLIEAEDFDSGGEGVSWHDLTAGNQGGFYRTGTDVDIVPATGNALGAVVNNFQTGEWLAYTVNVAQTGAYRLEIHASSEMSTGRWRVEVDGVNVTGSVAVPNTGSWSTFQWIGVGGISLAAGQHVLRVHAEQEYFNFDSLRVVSGP